MLDEGLHSVFSDLDVVWLQDPLPWMRQLTEPNVLMSSDVLSTGPSPSSLLDDCKAVTNPLYRIGEMGPMNVRTLMLIFMTFGRIPSSRVPFIVRSHIKLFCKIHADAKRAFGFLLHFTLSSPEAPARLST